MTLAILLLGLGLALVVAEVLFPSFGVLSILATLAILGSLFAAFQESRELGFQFLVVTMVLVPTMIMIGFKVFPKSPFGKLMVAPGLSFAGEAATDERDLELLGSVGVVSAACRPAGMARLGGRRVDVVTRGEWIEAGREVRVVEVSGNRVVVTELPSSTGARD